MKNLFMDLNFAPNPGLRFHEDCTDYIVTREDEVFGEGNKWPPEYDPWELGAKILSCAGHGTDAHIRIAPGLMGEKKCSPRPLNPPFRHH